MILTIKHFFLLEHKDRNHVMRSVTYWDTEFKKVAENYAKKYNVDIHYSGMPYMRSVQSVTLKKEIVMFIFLTLFITSLILYLFFRSFKATFIIFNISIS